jgi:hypothetical protein
VIEWGGDAERLQRRAGHLLADGFIEQVARTAEQLQVVHLEPLAVHRPPDRPEIAADHPRLLSGVGFDGAYGRPVCGAGDEASPIAAQA